MQTSEKTTIIEYLLNDWSKPMRSTSIPLAMENLRMPPDDGIRLEIGDHFRKNPGLSDNLKFYGVNNYILSNDEKITAKYLIGSFKTNGRLPEKDEICAELKISLETVESILVFLERAGFLKKDQSNGCGFKLTEGYEFWGGPLRFNFHTVRVEGEFPYDVW